MNWPNIKKFIGIALGIFTLSLMTISISAEVNRSSGERISNPIFVECLNTYITLDYSWTRLESEVTTDNNWNYTRRMNYSGLATDNSSDDSWSWKSGWSTTEHVSLTDTEAGIISRVHHQSKDILIAHKDNTAGNLLLTWNWRAVFDYRIGEWLVDEERESISCTQ